MFIFVTGDALICGVLADMSVYSEFLLNNLSLVIPNIFKVLSDIPSAPSRREHVSVGCTGAGGRKAKKKVHGRVSCP